MLLTVTACAPAAFGAFMFGLLCVAFDDRLVAFSLFLLAGFCIAVPALVVAGLWPRARESSLLTAAAILAVAFGLALLFSATVQVGW